jgi:hypothetical protein
VKRRIIRFAAAVLLAVGVSGLGGAQPSVPPGMMPPSAERLAPAQLDQLTAPVALYPDPLLGSILAAATYPLEVAEAARWLEDPAHAALRGDALAAALEQERWDPSVKTLVSAPEALRMMNSNLEWTEQIGDAFLAQQAEVMDSVQRLRQRAAAAGTLRSTPQQTVTMEPNDITIEPANPDVVYVPYYVPADVYGPWAWPDYPPYYFPLPPDVVWGGALIGFGIGIPIFEPLWGWYGWNWPGHGFVVFPHRPHFPGHPAREEQASRTWQHEPDHRRGVPYRDSAMAAHYLGSDAAARRPFRGYPAAPAPRLQTPSAAPTAAERRAPAAAAPMPRPTPPAAARPGPAAFESFGRGPQVRGESARGFSSRSTSAPSFHGGGGGHAGHR